MMEGMYHGLGKLFKDGELVRYGYWSYGAEHRYIEFFEEVRNFPPQIVRYPDIQPPQEIMDQSVWYDDLKVRFMEPRTEEEKKAREHADDCPICYEKMTSDREPVVTRCGHYFCGQCILDHASSQNNPQKTCPICREPFARCLKVTLVS